MYLLTLVYFLVLYFGVGWVFKQVCIKLEAKRLLHKIEQGQVKPEQTNSEIRNSLVSIFLFGFSSLPVIWLIRESHVHILKDSPGNIFIGLLILNLWNELHFFLVHRLMHTKYFMSRVHVVHHRSFIPSIYSVYSFHWFEALLLSTVPLTIVPLLPFSPLAIFIYPFTSILLNFAGHCNYRFGNGNKNSWMELGTRHNKHHSKGAKTFGFALTLFDKLTKPSS